MLADLGYVVTGEEGAAFAREDEAAHAAVRGECCQVAIHELPGFDRHRVQPVGAVEDEPGDVAVPAEDDTVVHGFLHPLPLAGPPQHRRVVPAGCAGGDQR